MDITVVFQSIIFIFILIVIGAFSAKYYTFNSDIKNLYIVLITNIAMPSIILSSIFKVGIGIEILKKLLLIFLISIFINILGIGLGFIITLFFKRYSTKKVEIAILSALGNTGFIGIPLCAVLFGSEGALYAAGFDAGVDVIIWTLGVYLVQKNKQLNLNLLKGIVNIPLLAIVIGIIIAITNLKIPSIIVELTNSLASFAIPLSMFYIGALINNSRRSFIKTDYLDITIPIVIKLILLPFIVIVFIFIFKTFDDLLVHIVIVQSMMPALTLSSILFAKYSRDESLGAFVTILSTLLSILTIPGLLFLLSYFI